MITIGSGGSLLGHWRQSARVQGLENIWTDTPGAHQGESYSKGVAFGRYKVDREPTAKARKAGINIAYVSCMAASFLHSVLRSELGPWALSNHAVCGTGT